MLVLEKVVVLHSFSVSQIQEFQIQCEEQQMVLRLSLNVGSIEAEFLSYSHGMHKIGVEDCNSRVETHAGLIIQCL